MKSMKVINKSFQIPHLLIIINRCGIITFILQNMGVLVMIRLNNLEEIRTFVANEVMFTSEAAQFLGISNQRLNQLVQTGKLQPVKVNRTASLFLKADLEKRKENFAQNQIEPNNIKNDLVNVRFGNSIEIIYEAMNYYTIQSFFKYSDKKTIPEFNKLKSQINVKLPMVDAIKDFAQILLIEEELLSARYTEIEAGFAKLNKDDYIVKKGDEFYPKLLEQTKEAPPYLFMRGNVQLANMNTIAIVGSRKASEDGTQKAWNLARLLGKFQLVVASGLAAGIDAAAHNGSLYNRYPTIAVIGTPLTKNYPKENKELQKQIEGNGLVISQFPPTTPIQRWNFPMRNAIMSGISLATVVVEAGETSGALIQADYALKQKRLVFIPQSAVNNPKIEWPKKFLRREGAEEFSKINELLDKLEKSEIINSTVKQINLFEYQYDRIGVEYVNTNE